MQPKYLLSLRNREEVLADLLYGTGSAILYNPSCKAVGLQGLTVKNATIMIGDVIRLEVVNENKEVTWKGDCVVLHSVPVASPNKCGGHDLHVRVVGYPMHVMPSGLRLQEVGEWPRESHGLPIVYVTGKQLDGVLKGGIVTVEHYGVQTLQQESLVLLQGYDPGHTHENVKAKVVKVHTDAYPTCDCAKLEVVLSS